jgi:predicted DNA-binding protein (UPF0251 family)
MVRPRKIRQLCLDPKVTYFKPAWIPMSQLEDVELFYDEYEALKLVNLDSLNMQQWAKKLWISAPTFNRIINSAHKKISDAIINWKAIKIKEQ